MPNTPSAVAGVWRRRGPRDGCGPVLSETDDFAGAPDVIDLRSPAFADGGAIPPCYTADGERLSPPLAWSGLPQGAKALTLVVQTPDALSPDPLVHLLAFDLPPHLHGLEAGNFRSPGGDVWDDDPGEEAGLQALWLPPDPLGGLGPRRYVFQMFALDRRLDFDRPPSLKRVAEAMRGHVLAKGVLVGAYERAERAWSPVSPTLAV